MKQKYIRHDFAPMEGVTSVIYRNLHRTHFGGVDRYYMPFLSIGPHCGFSQRELRELEDSTKKDVIPQLLGKDARGFIWAVQWLREHGYNEVNLNLGCPSGTVTAKGKGAGFLTRPKELDAFLHTVYSALDGPISIKTRLGMYDPGEFSSLLDIYNQYPVTELTIHPRVAKDYYRHPVRMEVFAESLQYSKNPICYTGDLVSRADCDTIEAAYPQLRGVMVGRALIADPSLFAPQKHTKERLHAFHRDVFAAYTKAFGHPRSAMMRMKEIWFYHIHLFDGGQKLSKQLRRNNDPVLYERMVEEIYHTLPLRPTAYPGWLTDTALSCITEPTK